MAIQTKLFLLSILLLSATFSFAYLTAERKETQDPQREFQKCQELCQSQEQQQRCQQDCQKQYEQQQQQGRGGGGSQEQEQEQNPYLFPKESFSARITSPHGNLAVLERFDRRSELLKGIQNYRVVYYEANPSAFMLPNHWDADSICVVINGRASITLIQQEKQDVSVGVGRASITLIQQEKQENKRETRNLKAGDIFRINAGTTLHFVNTDNNQKFTMVELTMPVDTPGRFASFFPAASRDQESYFNALSDEVLQAAFNVDKDQLSKMFKGQNEGQFVRASQQQIRALSERSSEGGLWPFHQGDRRSSRPFNLFNQRPTQSNQYGQLYEVNTDEHKQLQDLDVQVSYANIFKGAMIAPFYNSRATEIYVVVSGNGYFEMACPHLSQRQQKGTQYQKVRGQIKAGDVFVAPAGHPVVIVASNDQSLEVVCYETGAEDNLRTPLAGKNNILSQLQDEAKELSFNIDAKQVDEILNKQKESWFFPGPQQRQHHQG